MYLGTTIATKQVYNQLAVAQLENKIFVKRVHVGLF